MCPHTNTRKINDVRVCLNCGMTISNDGRILFDKKIVNYKPRKKNKRRSRNGKN